MLKINCLVRIVLAMVFSFTTFANDREFVVGDVEKPLGIAAPYLTSPSFYVAYAITVLGVEYIVYSCEKNLQSCLEGKQVVDIVYVETRDKLFQSPEGYKVGYDFASINGSNFSDNECKLLPSNWLACRTVVNQGGQTVYDNAIFRFIKSQ